MTKWSASTLGEVAAIDRRSVAPNEIISGTTYVGLENVTSGGYFDSVGSVDAGELASSKFRFTPGHILYGKLRPYLRKIARPDFRGICSTDILPILPGDSISRDFLFHFLRTDSSVSFVNSRTSGANLPRISPTVLEEIVVPLPPLAEQRRIAAILDQAEALRTKRRQALAKLDTLTQSLFLEMFGDPGVNSMDWDRRSLDEITSRITDGEHLNPTFSDTGMPIIMAGNVLEDSIDIAGAKKVDLMLGERFRRKCKPEIGDLLLVSRGATIGRMCALSANDSFCMMGSVILIKPIKEKIDSVFLSSLLKHPVMRAALYKTSGSSAQQAIYLKDLKNMPCIVPPIELQVLFSRRAASIAAASLAHRSSLGEMGTLFAALQQRAFKGAL
jgi:type I restriction enzyme S subunit